MASVTAKGARGGGVVLSASGVSILIQLASVVILSRLVTPADFGLLAMAAVFLALGTLLRDFGMPMAALQAKELTDQQASNLFWMSFLLAFLATLGILVGTPLAVVIYSEPRLMQIVPVMASVVFMSGLSAQLQVQLARRMRFLALGTTEIAAQAVGLLLAVVLGLRGFGYWALVSQHVVAAGILLVFRWIALGWVPQRYRRGHGSVKMFRSGAEYGLAYLLQFAQTYGAALMIGIRLEAVALGYYNRAQQLLLAPSQQILAPLNNVVVPTVNGVRLGGDDPAPLLLRVQFIVGCGLSWLFAVTAGVAPMLIPLALGAGWGPAVPIFQVLAIGGCLGALSHVSYWIFVAHEQSRQLLMYNLVSKPLVLIALIVGSGFGVEGVAWGYSIGAAVSWPINLLWLARTARLPYKQFLSQGMIILLGGSISGLAAWAVSSVSQSLGSVGGIVLGVIAGSVCMVGTVVAFGATRRLLGDIPRIVRSLIRTDGGSVIASKQRAR